MFEARPFAQIELESLAGIRLRLGSRPVELVVAVAQVLQAGVAAGLFFDRIGCIPGAARQRRNRHGHA